MAGAAQEILKLEWLVEKPVLYQASELASLLPTLPFSLLPNQNHTLVKFTLVHTLPAVNAKGRAVTYPTQKNSLASVTYNPVSFEHLMVSNPNFSPIDKILGVMLCASIEEVASNPVIPDHPIPTVVWAILWNRIEEVQRIIQDTQDGNGQWKCSYEIQNRSEDALLVGDQFMPISQAPPEWRAQVACDNTGFVNGQRVILVLGGENGYIDYWGAGLTLTPADQLNPNIQLETASIAKNNQDEGDVQMTKEEQAQELQTQALEALKTQLASLSPALQTLITHSGLDAAKASQLGESIKSELESKFSEIASQVESKMKTGFISIQDKDTEIATAVKTALESELPKARSTWEQELASIQKREAEIASANIPLTDARKLKLKEFSFDEAGQTAFEAYLAELKEIASLKPATPPSSTPTTKETASQTPASIGSLLNTNTPQAGTEQNLAGLFS